MPLATCNFFGVAEADSDKATSHRSALLLGCTAGPPPTPLADADVGCALVVASDHTQELEPLQPLVGFGSRFADIGRLDFSLVEPVGDTGGIPGDTAEQSFPLRLRKHQDCDTAGGLRVGCLEFM